MEVDLKKENNRNLFLIMAASLVLSIFFQFDLKSLSSLNDYLIAGSGSLMLSVVLVMLANILPQNLKHKFVFTRMVDELPACRIDRLCKKEPRLEYELIKERWPDVFSSDIDSATRNSRWYQQIYKSVKDTKEVLQAHRSFLLYRDAFSGLALIFLVTVVWSLIGNSEIIGVIKPIVLLTQGMFMSVALIAARISGNRFVVNAVVAAQ